MGTISRYVVGISLALLVAIPVSGFVRQSFDNASAALREANMNKTL